MPANNADRSSPSSSAAVARRYTQATDRQFIVPTSSGTGKAREQAFESQRGCSPNVAISADEGPRQEVNICELAEVPKKHERGNALVWVAIVGRCKPQRIH
jgi:hypothetical protein